MSLTTTSPLPKDLEKSLMDQFKRFLEMDKQIAKVKKSLDKGEKEVKVLKKMDKKFDKKLEKCGEKMKKK